MAGKKNITKSPSIGDKTDRDGKGRFAAGNKGGGRKKLPDDVKEMFRAATPNATRLLIDTMNDTGADLKLRIDCAERIIERVYGKPTQPIDGDMVARIEIKLPEGVGEYAD